MDAARAEVAHLESCLAAEALFNRSAPLLNILCGRVRIERREADGGCAKNCWDEIEGFLRCSGVEQRSGRIEIVKLLGFGKNKGNVVTLVAPGVEVDGSKEDPA
jgi:hypothetical protein